MRDAASAAAMSDPERNRWFRRRWVEAGPTPIVLTPAPAAIPARLLDDQLNLLGHQLLQQWRCERSSKEAVR